MPRPCFLFTSMFLLVLCSGGVTTAAAGRLPVRSSSDNTSSNIGSNTIASFFLNRYDSAAFTDSVPGLTKPDSALTFLVLGDWGRNGDAAQRKVATTMAKAAAQISAAFIVATGDNFYENGVRDTMDVQWHSSFENVYSDSALQVPWFPVLGNHDYNLNPDAQVEYSASHPRWRMPARYYDTTMLLGNDSILFVFIDTDPIEKYFLGRPPDSLRFRDGDVQRQLKWMEGVLASSRARWKVVTGHNPVHTGGSRRHSSRTRKMRNILQPVFTRYSVDLYLAGHEHHLEYLKPRTLPTHHIISGAGSETRHVGWLKRHRRFAARSTGFATVSFTHDRMVISFVSASGRVLYTGTSFHAGKL